MKQIQMVTLCVICAATLMGGCIESDNSISVDQQPFVADPVPDEANHDYLDGFRDDTSDNNTVDFTITTEHVQTTIPDDYYNITVDQYFIDHKMYDHLDGYTWGRPTGVGSWSFREAAELEHELTEKGCNVKIRWADCKTTIDHSDFEARVKTDGYDRWGGLPEMDQVSCWLMIELGDEWVAYSPTGCYWIFEPSYGKNEYVRNGKWHDNWYYTEGTTSIWVGCTWTSYNFIDFDDIYELEEYYMSGEMQARDIGKDKNGVWWSYVNSDGYNATDDFMVSFGWWMDDDEYHERETRINEATDWFVLVE